VFFTLPVAQAADIDPSAAPQVFYNRGCPILREITKPV
jgi:hypothetical protein